MLSGQELVIVLFTVFLGATVMGVLGFGCGLVVAPVLLLFVEPQEGVVIVNGLIAVLVGIVVVRTRRHLQMRLVGPMSVAGMVAVPFGALMLANFAPTVLRIVIGLVILTVGVLTLFNIQMPMVRRRFAGAVIGFLTSLSITTLSIGGPLVAIYAVAQEWPAQTVRTTLAFYFLVSYLTGFVFYAWSGLVGPDTVANIGVLIPGLVAGLVVASFLVHRIDQRVFRYAVVVLVIAGSLSLLGRELAG